MMVLGYMIRTLVSMLPFIPLAVALRLLAIPQRRRRGLRTTAWHEAGAALLILWVGAILAQTVSLESFRNVLETGCYSTAINLTPLLTIREMLTDGHPGVAAVNIIGNIAIFVPVGLLPPLLWHRCDSGLTAAGTGFFLSLLIETAQLFSYRSTDVDDLILNTLGAVLGYLLWLLLRHALPGLIARFRTAPWEDTPAPEPALHPKTPPGVL